MPGAQIRFERRRPITHARGLECQRSHRALRSGRARSSRARCAIAFWRCRPGRGMKSSWRYSKANTWWARASPSGHLISNVSCGSAAALLINAVRTRTRAKREHSGSAAAPSRQVMVRANQKKLFFNLRKAKSKISALEGHPGSRWTVTASPIAKMINAGNTIAKPIVFASIVTSLARIRHEG